MNDAARFSCIKSSSVLEMKTSVRKLYIFNIYNKINNKMD